MNSPAQDVSDAAIAAVVRKMAATGIDGNSWSTNMEGNRILREARELQQAQVVGESISADYYTAGDLEQWLEHPADIVFVNGLKVGDRYELQAINQWTETYEVTKVPDDTSDDYDVRRVEPITPQSPAMQQAQSVGGIRCYVAESKESCDAGPKYWVTIERDGKTITPYHTFIRGRAEYEVAEWNHLLTGAVKPDILAYDTEPATPQSSAPVVGGDNHLRRLIGKLAQWQHCMGYNDSYFGEPTGLVKQVVGELAHAVDPIYPAMPEPVNPFAEVVIHTATESFTPNADGTRPAESVAQGGEWREKLQRQCSEWGAYWRAPDAHGVELTEAQAIDLLAEVLGVEVEIKEETK